MLNNNINSSLYAPAFGRAAVGTDTYERAKAVKKHLKKEFPGFKTTRIESQQIGRSPEDLVYTFNYDGPAAANVWLKRMPELNQGEELNALEKALKEERQAAEKLKNEFPDIRIEQVIPITTVTGTKKTYQQRIDDYNKEHTKAVEEKELSEDEYIKVVKKPFETARYDN